MKYKALLFGSIGTLIESSNIQRNSFNEAFKEAGLDWYWDEQDYRILLKKSGGTKRVEDFAEKNNINVNASQIRDRKTELFSSFIIQNKQKLRESVYEMIMNQKENSIDLSRAVIKDIIEKYKGEIKIKNEENSSVLTFVLPLNQV